MLLFSFLPQIPGSVIPSVGSSSCHSNMSAWSDSTVPEYPGFLLLPEFNVERDAGERDATRDPPRKVSMSQRSMFVAGFHLELLTGDNECACRRLASASACCREQCSLDGLRGELQRSCTTRPELPLVWLVLSDAQ